MSRWSLAGGAPFYDALEVSYSAVKILATTL